MGRGKNLSEENCVCAAQLPARVGGRPECAGPRALPGGGAPTCLRGRGQRGGPDVTRGLGQLELSFPSPKGIPGPKRGTEGATRRRRPPTRAQEGPHLFGDTEAGPPGQAGPARAAVARGPAPAPPGGARGTAGVTRRVRGAQGTPGWGSRGPWGAVSFARGAGHRGQAQPRPSPGPQGRQAPLDVPSPDPGPQPVRAGHKVPAPAGARKTRAGLLPGRSRRERRAARPGARQGNRGPGAGPRRAGGGRFWLPRPRARPRPPRASRAHPKGEGAP